jgi:hypothetical protein
MDLLSTLAKSEPLLKKRLAKFDDIYKAEEFLRTLPLALDKKRKLLRTDSHLVELQSQMQDHAPNYHITKVIKIKIKKDNLNIKFL